MSLENSIRFKPFVQDSFWGIDGPVPSGAVPFQIASDNGSVLMVDCGQEHYGTVWMYSSATNGVFQVADDLTNLFEWMAQQLRIGGYHWNHQDGYLQDPDGYGPDREPGHPISLWSRTT